MTGESEAFDADGIYGLLRRRDLGDHEAVQELLARNMRWMHERASRELSTSLRVTSGQDSGDVVQTAIRRALMVFPSLSFKSADSLKSFLLLMVRRVVLDLSRRIQVRRAALAREVPLGCGSQIGQVIDPASGSTPSALLMREEQLARVRLALELLEPEDHELIRLATMEGRSFKELSNLLGKPESTLRNRRNQALHRLTEMVDAIRMEDMDQIRAQLDTEARREA